MGTLKAHHGVTGLPTTEAYSQLYLSSHRRISTQSDADKSTNWTVYGAAVEDAPVWAPNLAGVALAAAQLALKLAFRGAPRASTTAIATAAKGVS